jgi:acyl-homoserine lactone acylase PvdQ
VQLREHHPAVWPDVEGLLAWDARFTTDSEPAALFVLLRRALFHALLEDELGADDLAAYMGVSLLAYNGIQETVRSGRSSFWDDVGTPQVEQPPDIWARALRRARADRDTQAGRTASLGEVRGLLFPHAFSGQPLLGRLFSVGPLPGSGDDYTVNVRKAAPGEPQRPLFIPSWRVVYSAGDWAASRASQPLGQSGHRFSAFRNDQLAAWRSGEPRPTLWNGGAAAVIGRLRLLPQGAAH